MGWLGLGGKFSDVPTKENKMKINNFNATIDNIGEGWNGTESEVIAAWNATVAPRLVEIRESENEDGPDAWHARYAHEGAWKTFCEFSGSAQDRANATLAAMPNPTKDTP